MDDKCFFKSFYLNIVCKNIVCELFLPSEKMMMVSFGIAPGLSVPLVFAKFWNDIGTSNVFTFTNEKKRTLKVLYKEICVTFETRLISLAMIFSNILSIFEWGFTIIGIHKTSYTNLQDFLQVWALKSSDDLSLNCYLKRWC